MCSRKEASLFCFVRAVTCFNGSKTFKHTILDIFMYLLYVLKYRLARSTVQRYHVVIKFWQHGAPSIAVEILRSSYTNVTYFTRYRVFLTLPPRAVIINLSMSPDIRNKQKSNVSLYRYRRLGYLPTGTPVRHWIRSVLLSPILTNELI